MPQPHTGESQITGRQLWTFDSAGNLFVAGNAFVGATPDPTKGPNGPLAGGTAVATMAGGGGVAGITAADGSIVIGGSGTNPTLATGTLDVIAADHPPAANWSNNGQKITSIANGTGAQDAAAFGQLAAYAPLAGATFTGAVVPAVVSLVFGSSIAVNAAAGNDFRLTLTASTGTLANPTNPADGQRILFQITQGGAGGFTLAYGGAYMFSAGLPSPTLSTPAGDVDLLLFIYNAALTAWLFAAFVPGF